MATGLSEALALLEQIDTGEAVREFYFLRGPASPEWSVHNREGGVWTVTKAPNSPTRYWRSSGKSLTTIGVQWYDRPL